MKIACCIKCCWDQVGVMVENSSGVVMMMFECGMRSDNSLTLCVLYSIT